MSNMRHQLKRIVIGLLAMIAASIAQPFIPSFFPFTPPAADADPFFMSQPLPTIEQSLRIGVAAFIGAYFARVPFVLATIVYYVAMTLFAFYVLTLIAEPVEPVSIFDVAARNAIGTGIGLVTAVVGAYLGFQLHNARRHNSPRAT